MLSLNFVDNSTLPRSYHAINSSLPSNLHLPMSPNANTAQPTELDIEMAAFLQHELEQKERDLAELKKIATERRAEAQRKEDEAFEKEWNKRGTREELDNWSKEQHPVCGQPNFIYLSLLITSFLALSFMY
jgi:hypothetical protein